MTHIEDVLLHAVAQKGDRYVFSAAVDFDNPNPREFDCSGLVQWSCRRADVKPRLPRSSFEQARHCIQQKSEMTVDAAVATRGALLFKFTRGVDLLTIKTRPETAHVAWSLGNGSTIEAMGKKWGVGSFSADPKKREWTHAARIPGVEYSARSTTEIPAEEEEVTKVLFFKGAAGGEVHVYAVTGGVGKHLSPEAIKLHTFFKTPTIGSTSEPLGKEWQDGVALLDGPLRNIA